MDIYRDYKMESKITFEVAAPNDALISEDYLNETCESLAAILTNDSTMKALFASDLQFSFYGDEITLMTCLSTALDDDEDEDDAINFFESCFDSLEASLSKIGCAVKKTDYWDDPDLRPRPFDLTVGLDEISI